MWVSLQGDVMSGGFLAGVEWSVGNGNSVLYCSLCWFDCVVTKLFVLPYGMLVVGRWMLSVGSGLVSAVLSGRWLLSRAGVS